MRSRCGRLPALLALSLLAAGCGPLFWRTPSEQAVTRTAALEMYWKGKARPALALYEARVRALEPAGPSSALLSAYMAAAQAAGSIGRYEAGLDYAQKAAGLSGQDLDWSLVDLLGRYAKRVETLGQLASAYEALGKHDEAERVLRDALVAADDIPIGDGPWLWKAWMKEKLVPHLRRRGELAEAARLAREALDAREGILTLAELTRWIAPRALTLARRWAVNSNLTLAGALTDAGRLDEARRHTERALRLARAEREASQEAAALGRLAGLEHQRGRYAEALALREQVLAIQRRLDSDSPGVAFTLGSIGAHLRGLGRHAEALEALREAMRRHEDFRSVFASARSRSVVFERRLGAYALAVLTLLDLGRAAEAFEVGERVRARAFLDVLALRTPLARPARPDLVDEERALRARIEEIRALPESGPAAAERTRLLAQAREAYDRFLERLQHSDAEQASLRAVEPLRAPDVQALLEPATAMLEYLVTGDETVVWLVEPGGLRAARVVIAESELRRRVEALRRAIEARDEPAAEAGAEDLGRLLLAPLAGRTDLARVVVVPHGVLHYLPFQALRRQGRALIEDVEVTYLPSASVMRFTRDKARRAAAGPVVGVGNPDLEDPRLDLRHAEREVRALGELFSDAVVFVRQRASRAAITPETRQARILHFATHADFDAVDPLGTALLLAPADGTDGRLEAHEIYGWALGADLVVLSACETGIGSVSQGDEVIGLTRAFIYAGASSVITTLWQVDDRASAFLMDRFYRALAGGAGKGAALRHAQLATMRAFPAAYFWAGYQLTGEPGSPVRGAAAGIAPRCG